MAFDPLKQPEQQIPIETTQMDFIYVNPILGVSDYYTVYSQALGIISSLVATEEKHRAIMALLNLAKEISQRDELTGDYKEDIIEQTKALELAYYGAKERQDFAKMLIEGEELPTIPLYWLRSRKRAIDQKLILAYEEDMDWDTWIDSVTKAEDKIFGEEKPFPTLMGIIRYVLNNRMEVSIARWRKILADCSERLAIIKRIRGFREIFKISFVKGETFIESEFNIPKKDIKMALESYTLPNELVYKGMDFDKDKDGKLQFTRFGIDSYYNLQRDLTQMAVDTGFPERLFHFFQAMKFLNSKMKSYMGKGNKDTIKVIELKRNKEGESHLDIDAFQELFALLKLLGRLLKLERLTLTEHLTLEELRTDVEVEIMSFMASMQPILADALAHNPHIRSGKEEVEARDF